MAESTPTITVPKGLEHVVLGETSISLVAGQTGGLVYRGYAIDEIVPNATYEEVVHLLLRGVAPTREEGRELTRELARRRALPPGLERVVDALPTRLPPLDAMRTLLSALGEGDFPYPPTEAQGLELIAKTPTLLARYVRRARGHRPVAPRPELGHAANYLYMLEGSPPSGPRARALEQYLILLADHGMNASTFALRTVLSTNSDLVSAATAALGALKGPAHGGAPSRVVDMLDAIGAPERAPGWIASALARHERLFGFGHRAYKVEDPRAVLLKRIARDVAAPSRLQLAEAVEAEALRALEREKPGRRLYTNVEFYGAVVLEAVGLTRDLFTPTFAVGRTAGWAAHALEQASDNRLIRPDIRYTGTPAGRTWPPNAPEAR